MGTKGKHNVGSEIQSPYIKTEKEIDLMEKAARIVAETLVLLGKYIKSGITTAELDTIAEDYIRSKGAKPAFKGYKVDGRAYPNTLCISIDEEVVHGLPGARKLEEGQIVSIDCGSELKGYFGDSAISYPVGKVNELKQKLLRVTEESLMKGIEHAVERNKIYDISRAVQTFVESNGFNVTRELVGHGIGKHLHEEPPVPNFVPPLLHRSQYPNVKLQNGMALAIEPMVHAGGKSIKTARDGWTVLTADKSPAAHFEHTIVINGDKPIILTLRD
ncbi:type I methionyl aminopeptidase [Bacteroidetes/Chlorobi group bacterium ChocPot_Mid]|jgi:methionyl aminopeptidase|nr:MAG: type I methionyl aminopeptidase [Bacteroidetes/Chlorobi group bacterium ChocPot_Mid]